MTEYVGAIVLELDGKEIDVANVSVTINAGRKLVKTMNRLRRARGFSKTVKEVMLKVTAVIDPENPVVWEDIEGAKISIENPDGTLRESYLECGTISVGKQYDTENEARIDIDMYALDHVVE